MNNKKFIIFGSVALVLFSYNAWTSARIIRLETRLKQLETSQNALGFYTYDFGTKLTGLNSIAGIPGSELAKGVMMQMQRDNLMRTALASGGPDSISASPILQERNKVHNASP